MGSFCNKKHVCFNQNSPKLNASNLVENLSLGVFLCQNYSILDILEHQLDGFRWVKYSGAWLLRENRSSENFSVEVILHGLTSRVARETFVETPEVTSCVLEDPLLSRFEIFFTSNRFSSTRRY